MLLPLLRCLSHLLFKLIPPFPRLPRFLADMQWVFGLETVVLVLDPVLVSNGAVVGHQVGAYHALATVKAVDVASTVRHEIVTVFSVPADRWSQNRALTDHLPCINRLFVSLLFPLGEIVVFFIYRKR